MRSTCWIGSTSCSSSRKALDEIRAEEAKKLVKDGYEPVLKKSRWCLLVLTGEPDGQSRR